MLKSAIPLIFLSYVLPLEVMASAYEKPCAERTTILNDLLLSDSDSNNDYETLGSEECLCEINLVMKELGEEQARRYADYYLMGLDIDIEFARQPDVSKDKFMQWITSEYPNYFVELAWAEEMIESLPRGKSFGLDDPMSVCY